MPHFENIDQYEASRTKGGRKKVIPIAPHSMQAVDYSPRRRKEKGSSQTPPQEQFDPVPFDPTLVRKMEREFKQAVRADSRRDPNRGLSGLLKKIKAFFTGKKTRKKSARKRAGKGQPGRTHKPAPSSRHKGKPPREGKPDGNPAQRRKRRRKRPNAQKGGQGKEESRGKGMSRPGNDGSRNKRNPNRRRRRRPSGDKSSQGQQNRRNRDPSN